MISRQSIEKSVYCCLLLSIGFCLLRCPSDDSINFVLDNVTSINLRLDKINCFNDDYSVHYHY